MCKVANMVTEKINKAKELPNLVNVFRRGGVPHSFEFVFAGQYALGCELETKVCYILRAENAFVEIDL